MGEAKTTGGMTLPTLTVDASPGLIVLPFGLTDDLMDSIVLAVLDHVDRDTGLIGVFGLRAALQSALEAAARSRGASDAGDGA